MSSIVTLVRRLTDSMILCSSSVIGYLRDHLLRRRSNRSNIESLSDDLIIVILSRLAVDCVVECRKVCKRWNRLISTSYFAEQQLQLAKDVPLLLAENRTRFPFSYLLEVRPPRKAKTDQPICVMHPKQFERKYIIGSCDGLILFRRSGNYLFVSNPVTDDYISLPQTNRRSQICGFFFHPRTREYSLLNVYDECDRYYEYEILGLRTNSWRKLTNVSHYRPFTNRINAGFAVPANGCLYWMVKHGYKDASPFQPKTPETSDNKCANSILRFQMDTEVFDTIPHPRYERCNGPSSSYIQLINMEGLLCLCHLFSEKIEVWILLDTTNLHWVQRYQVDLDWVLNCFPGLKGGDIYCITILMVENGELTLEWYNKGLFTYNLETRVAREIRKENTSEVFWLGPFWHYYFTYRKSLINPSSSFTTLVKF